MQGSSLLVRQLRRYLDSSSDVAGLDTVRQQHLLALHAVRAAREALHVEKVVWQLKDAMLQQVASTNPDLQTTRQLAKLR